MDGREGLDIVVSNRSSGDVDVLFNDPAHTFARTARYRAGVGVSGLQDVDGRLRPRSREEPVSLVAGLFTSEALPDVVVVNRGAHHFGTLVGTPGGGFTNPQEGLRFSTSQGFDVNDRPGQVVAGDFDRDGRLDVAILMEDRGEVWLYKGFGDGHFVLLSRVAAGNAPSGLAADDINGDGNPDLMVGNGFGDILFILGNGNGIFRPFVRADQRVPLVVTDLNRDGVLDVVLGDQARDLASAQLRIPGTRDFTPGAFQRDGSNGLIGPGDVALADLDGRNGTDLIFANTGSNNVLVYLRQPDGSFADKPFSFFAGTSPAALHVADLNRDGMLDLATANQGSNDVSVLLGSRDSAGDWTFRFGPRLRSGGLGPNGVTAVDVTGDGIPDLLATNGQSGTLATIPGIGAGGVGTGFFDDGRLTTAPIAQGPVRQTDIVNRTLGFALTQPGAVVGFNPTTGATFVVPVGREVSALDALASPGSAFPILFTANRDGTVSALTTEDGQTFNEQVFPGGADNPSALEVLEAGDGLFEVYLTEAGDLRPIVLTITLRAELTPADNNPFVPAVALVTDLPTDLPSDSPSATPGTGPVPAANLVEAFNPLFVSQVEALDFDIALLQAVGGDVAGGEEEEEGPEEAEELAAEEPTLEELITGAREALERLSEDERTGREKPMENAEERPDGESTEGLLEWLLRAVEELPQDPKPAPAANDAGTPEGPRPGAVPATPAPHEETEVAPPGRHNGTRPNGAEQEPADAAAPLILSEEGAAPPLPVCELGRPQDGPGLGADQRCLRLRPVRPPGPRPGPGESPVDTRRSASGGATWPEAVEPPPALTPRTRLGRRITKNNSRGTRRRRDP